MEALIKDIFEFLLHYYALYLVIIMGIITTLIMVTLNLVKKPFKVLTAKITNERLRKFANNATIIFLSFGLSFAFWFLLNWISPDYFVIDLKEIILNGALPVVTYAFAEGWITSEKAKALITVKADQIAKCDLTVDKVKETVKDLNSVLDAEQELNNLLKK